MGETDFCKPGTMTRRRQVGRQTVFVYTLSCGHTAEVARYRGPTAAIFCVDCVEAWAASTAVSQGIMLPEPDGHGPMRKNP